MGIRNNLVNGLAGLLGVELTKAASATLQNNQQSRFPAEMATATYAPGFPIEPITRPDEVETPRTIDYPISINATLQPRTGYGLMPFSALADVYENITEVKMPIGTLLRILNSFKPRLVDKDGNQIDDHPYDWMTVSPDRKVPFDTWVTRFMKASEIFDAGAFAIHRDKDGINALKFIDGSTLFIIIDEQGEVPMPDQVDLSKAGVERYMKKADEWMRLGKRLPKTTPAYVQVIKGTPFGFYDQNQIWYKPRNRRYNAPYGETFIEQAWGWVMIIANITGFELAHYRQGNMPEGYFESPDGWSLTKISAYENAWNARMTGGATERQRNRFVPFGFKWMQTKKSDFPDKLYQKAFDNIVMTFGFPPSEFGQMSARGLGGKGVGDLMQDKSFRDGVLPRKTYLENALNNILKMDDVDDVQFELTMPDEDMDTEKRKASVMSAFAAGVSTLNETLGQLGLSPVGSADDKDNFANKHMVIQSGKVIILEDMKVIGGAGSDAPVGDKADEAMDHPQQPEDIVQAEKILTTGKLSTVTYSIPPLVKVADSSNHEFDFVLSGDVSQEQATRLLSAMNISMSDMSEFIAGLEEEREHTATVNNNPLIIAQIVLDHIAEDKQYYTHLSQVMTKITASELRKHCGVCESDDAYYQSPVSRETQINFPKDHHVNDVEIVAMCPDGLPIKPGVWKPEGGENENLQEKIGGKMYPREEAAYLLDRSLGFYLVPVTYTANVNGENGSVQYYSAGSARSEIIKDYDSEWIQRAGVFDYISSEQDRNTGNWLTHPDDNRRMILIDNGMSFPTDSDKRTTSVFARTIANAPLSAANLFSIKMCLKDAPTWKLIAELVGDDAADNARANAQRLLDDGMIEEAGDLSKRYKIEGEKPYRVVNVETGKTIGEHDTKPEAR